jgi:uncharacterized FAD-dependent dehydrogenase
MQKTFNFKLLPSEALNDNAIKNYIAKTQGVEPSAVAGYNILKRSIDARGKQPWINLLLQAFINEAWSERKLLSFHYRDVHTATRTVIIVGAGPAGLFAALRLIEAGIKPIVLERGKDVRNRRRDLAMLNKEGIVNPESNYCFGEGGAGTYSDGKLYTRSTKRGNVTRILNLFVRFGAEENILYESHPHIGTNKLPNIITAIRKQVLDSGGEIFFGQRVVDFVTASDRLTGVKTSNGKFFAADAVVLATGHSARDIFQLLHKKKIQIHLKPFALGVRVEHSQALIDSIQYHTAVRIDSLPPSSYSLVHQINGTGVFSFCMCPGGIIAPAATAAAEIVVNGWSPSKRNNPYANSGIVTPVEEKDLRSFKNHGPLAAMFFQAEVERKAFEAGGGRLIAPAQRLVDFCENKVSANLPACSYLPGIHSASLKEVLPDFIYRNLQQGFREFGRKMKGYFTNEAVVVATESRTSSPVRIPRDAETLQHVQIKNLYPCGEGAGYAGGIISAAIDGERVAEKIAIVFKHKFT